MKTTRFATASVIILSLLWRAPLIAEQPEDHFEVAIEDAIVLLSSRQFPEHLTIRGGYIRREYQTMEPLDLESEASRVRDALEEARRLRIDNERAFGRTPDVAELRRNDEQAVEEYIEKQKLIGRSDTTTCAVRLYGCGDKWREERMPLPNDISLPKLVEYVNEHGFDPNYVECWNGHELARIKRPLDRRRYPFAEEHVDHGYAVLAFDNPELMSVFDRSWQQVFSAELVATLETSGHSPDATISNNGHQTLTIKMLPATPDSTMMTVNFHGPCGFLLTESTTTVSGIVTHLERNTDFHQLTSDLFLPMHLLIETRSVEDAELISRIEHLAFESPETSSEPDAYLFNLADTDEFKSLPLDRSFLPQPPARIQPRYAPTSLRQQAAAGSAWRFPLVLFNIVVVVALIIWRIRHRRFGT